MIFRRRLRGALLTALVLFTAGAVPHATARATAAKTTAAASSKAVAKSPTGAPRRPGASAASTHLDCLGRAQGGLENIARIGTIYTRSQFETGGLRGTQVFWRDVRGAVRESLDVPGALSELVVFDGARGWRRGTNGAVLPLSGADLADRVTDAYLGSYMHLVPGRIPGKVERLGLDRATGLVKLRVQPQGGTPATLLLDTLTCLPVRIVRSTGDRTETLRLRDWRTVSGIRLPFAIRRSDGDTTRDVKLTLLEARFDARFPAGTFAKPAALAPPPAGATGP